MEEGPAAIQQLIDWGAEFDREGCKLAFTREGAHSRNRVLHAHGDSTGREIARTLYRKAASLPTSTFRSYATIIDLLLDDGVSGRRYWTTYQPLARRYMRRAVLLATGGLGTCLPQHHQPRCGHRRWRGDGLARRRGNLRHRVRPVPSHRAARGGRAAVPAFGSPARRRRRACCNARGERFMERYHPLKELAPRDVVARAIVPRWRAPARRTSCSI